MKIMTKGDFYIGTGFDARWIGSINHDAQPQLIPCEILIQINPIAFEEKVLDFLEKDCRSSIAQRGDEWPWPWADSRFTDFSYMFDLIQGRILASEFGRELFDPLVILQGEDLMKANIGGMPKFPLMRLNILRDGSHTT